MKIYLIIDKDNEFVGWTESQKIAGDIEEYYGYSSKKISTKKLTDKDMDKYIIQEREFYYDAMISTWTTMELIREYESNIVTYYTDLMSNFVVTPNDERYIEKVRDNERIILSIDFLRAMIFNNMYSTGFIDEFIYEVEDVPKLVKDVDKYIDYSVKYSMFEESLNHIQMYASFYKKGVADESIPVLQ